MYLFQPGLTHVIHSLSGWIYAHPILKNNETVHSSQNFTNPTSLASKISLIPSFSPLILHANCMSLSCRVMRLACIASRLASLSKLTRYASDASWRHSRADHCHLKGHATYVPFLYSLSVIMGGIRHFECALLNSL